MSSAERQADAESLGGVAITPTGRYVAFTSTASNLVAEDTNRNQADMYVLDLATGALTWASRSFRQPDGGRRGHKDADAGAAGDLGRRPVRRVPVIRSPHGLVPDDRNGEWDVFVRDAQTGGIERAGWHRTEPRRMSAGSSSRR